MFATGDAMPLLFTLPEYAQTSVCLRNVSGLKPGQFSITRYENEDLHATIESLVSAENCFVLGSIAPPDCQMLSVLLLAHTLKKEGANRVTGILPYLAYSREDKIKPGESLAAAWVGGLLKASALDEIWTVDLHSEEDKKLFPLPLESLSPANVFAECLDKLGLRDVCFVSPDQGAIPRCQGVKSKSGIMCGDIVYFEKHRTAAAIVHHAPVGKVERRAVIVDDILDTGETLVSACEKLVLAGAEELYICVTHGLFSGQRWRALWSLPVKHVFCTDTIPACVTIQDPRITVLSAAPVLREKLARDEASVEATS
ncbi:MAG TPA: ribose-phosphate diphosphokinase [Candidatus Acidoferrum sp.]